LKAVEPFILTFFSKNPFLPHAVAEDVTERCSKANSWLQERGSNRIMTKI
jgi:hypothetical protein